MFVSLPQNEYLRIAIVSLLLHMTKVQPGLIMSHNLSVIYDNKDTGNVYSMYMYN